MEITEKQKQKIEETAKKYRLKLVLLFGSRVSGKTHKDSDYDVAYLPSGNLSFDEEIDINSKFISIFPQKDGRVDTVDLRRITPLLLYMIFRQCQVLFAMDNLIFPVYRAYVFKKYIEAKPVYAEKFKKLSKEIENL